MIAVIARLTVKEGQEAQFEQVMGELAAQVREREAGCKLYQMSKGQTPRQYVMMERYESQEALALHGQTDYFRASFGKLGGMLDGRPSIELLTELG